MFTTGITEPFDATVSKAARIPQLGRSRPADPSVLVGGFSSLVVKVKGVAPFPDPDDPSADTSLYLGLYQTCPIVLLDDDTGNVFLFRVLNVEPAHAPASVDEVRLKIISDLRKLHGYQRAEALARQLEPVARSQGILAAHTSLDATVRTRVRIHNPPPFARIVRTERPPSRLGPGGIVEQPSPVRGIYGSTESRERFIQACFELGETPTTQPTDRRVRVLGRDDVREWVLIEWIETIPMRREDYRKEREKLLTMLRRQQQLELRRRWFDRENLRRRAGFHEIVSAEAEENEEASAPAGAAG